MGAKLAATVYVRDPETHQVVALEAGSEPEPRLAALVTNPSAWEGGKLPAAAQRTAEASDDSGGDGGDSTRQAAKTTAARKPARGRRTADEGSGGQ